MEQKVTAANSKKRDFTPINHQIRNPKVFCIDHENNNLGLIDTSKALEIARNNELDLVQVSFNAKENVPTCKILDYGKFKYNLSLNEKAAKKKQRESEVKIKEIKLRPNTAENDLKIKAAKAQEILNDGDKVKISVVFKGRELNYKENAYDTYNMFVSFLPEMKIVENPMITGKILSAMGQLEKQFIENQINELKAIQKNNYKKAGIGSTIEIALKNNTKNDPKIIDNAIRENEIEEERKKSIDYLQNKIDSHRGAGDIKLPSASNSVGSEFQSSISLDNAKKQVLSYNESNKKTSRRSE